jgi:tetratricopeptide (TPR) repeat protein
MKQVFRFVTLAAFGMACALTLISADQAPISLILRPSLSFPSPLDTHAEFFSWGAGSEVLARYQLPFTRFLSATVGLDYHYSQLDLGGSLSLLALSGGLGAQLSVTPWLYLRPEASAGYYYGLLNSGGGSGGDLYWAVTASVLAQLWPRVGLCLGAAYRTYSELSQSIAATFGLSYLISGRPGPALLQAKPAVRPQLPDLPNDGKGIDVTSLKLDEVFPIFHTYYDTHPIGQLTLKNMEKTGATNVKVSFIIKQYMDVAKECITIAELAPGASQEVDLYALFKNDILLITENTKVAAEIIVSSTHGKAASELKKSETVRVYNRNAMTWDDNRRAAAFVTAKDPAVLAFSNNVNALVRGEMNRAVDKKLQAAIAIHDALRLQGIKYVLNPLASYADVSKNKQAVDTLKFPKETFRYRSGDCSDLSILYCALLESLQIETAFITVPGHIFMAVALDTTPVDARKTFFQLDELIFMNDKVWIPIEVTERDGTFLEAWQIGAREWREHVAKGEAGFYPIRSAWNTYESVMLPGSSEGLPIVDSPEVVRDFQTDVAKFVQMTIYTKVAELQSVITKSNQSARSVNALGVLYARYDLVPQAESQFLSILQREEYVPAIINLGNLYYLQPDYEKALSWYERAVKIDPEEPRALLGLARACQQLEDYRTTRKAYEELKRVSPELAQQFAYLGLRGEDSTRAAEISGVKEKVVWDDE